MNAIGHKLIAGLFVLVAAAQADPTLRSGWVFVPGAQDLIQAGQWGCVSGVVQDSSALTIAAQTNYNTVINSSGPVVKLQGDFSVLATVSIPSGGSAFLTLVGTLNTGSDWWNGLKRLDAGISNGSLLVSYWLGTSSNGVTHSYALPDGTDTTFDMEIARIGPNLTFFVNGSQVGSFSDPGVFDSQQVFLGFNSAPQTTLKVLNLAAAMPSGSSDSLYVPGAQVVTRSGTGLRDLADKSGFLIGAAVDPSLFTSPGYAQALGSEFNLMVPENAMKFAETEPAPHQFNFCGADQIVQFAQANGMKVRGHNLVWQMDLPAWLTSGNYSSADAAAILQEHINTVMGHFKGQVIEWDVVNEAITYGPPYVSQPSYWLTQLGPNYLDMAFQWAHAADPNVKLFYNDTGGEGLGAKSDAVYSLVSGLISRGVPINGVGLQGHFTLQSAPSMADMQSNMARLAALGLDVHITELDIRVPVDANGNASASDLAAQATSYQNVFSACQAAPNCTAILTWGLTDAHSWIPGTYRGFGAALLLDASYKPKPAYQSVANTLTSAAKTAAPQIATGGVTIHGGSATVISPGSLVDIYGANLAAVPVVTPGLPLSSSLGNVQVKVNGTAVPLYYVSPGLAIFQLPYSTPPGPALVQVTSAAASSRSAAVTVQAAAPNILTYGDNWAIVQNADGSVNSANNCAAPNSSLTAYLIGSGPLDNAVATGVASPNAPLSRETLTTTATIGNAAAPVSFAGLTPGAVGLMQVNFQAPNVSGKLPLQVQVGSYRSNQATICVAGQ